jgi:hypothetical protein
MAEGDVGRQIVYHDQYGDHVGWVAEYVAGRDAGDHLVAGWHNSSAESQGPTFWGWSVYRNTGEQGTFNWFGEAIAPPDGAGEVPPTDPDAHPEHPIYWPPTIWPDPGHPEHPIVIPPPIDSGAHPEHPIFIPPSIWPNPDHPEHPIVLPPVDSGNRPSHPIYLPPEIWPPDAKPEHPIVMPPDEEVPPWWPGHPEHPIPPEIWPKPPESGKPPVDSDAHPSHPIFYPDAHPEHPIVLPPNSLPGWDLETNVPEHPDLPDLRDGFWCWVEVDGELNWSFVTNPFGEPSDKRAPVYPTEGLPGRWIVTILGRALTYAWIPDEAAEYPPQVEHH